MNDNSYEALGPLMTSLGNAVASQLGKLPKRAYVFVYCEDNWAQVALYVDEGEVVRLHMSDHELSDIATEIWSVDNGKRPKRLRWIYFDYDIEDGKFHTHFFFPEEITPGTEYDVWIETALKKRFGDKPIIQPDIPTVDDPPRP